MKGLVLLGDEVALLKFAAKDGVLSRTGPTLGHEIACEFFCEAGLAEAVGDELRLTPLGRAVSQKLIDSGASGTVSIPRSVLDALGPPFASHRGLEP
ncbi:hypothetical protein [Planctomyces sp. SH-PL14]|uniref:hypothetical protein n=1 Tax=Planctomyces sp. SH-PL14 TaxID=1632864 RepID=UPI00078DF50B|nr:hypothetical protein [Planctomyces sp. SH-PL14]AMV19191.1 hypothetical protein VT03_14975 [Planctomyces sp. SH-PL14]